MLKASLPQEKVFITSTWGYMSNDSDFIIATSNMSAMSSHSKFTLRSFNCFFILRIALSTNILMHSNLNLVELLSTKVLMVLRHWSSTAFITCLSFIFLLWIVNRESHWASVTLSELKCSIIRLNLVITLWWLCFNLSN